MLMGGRRGSCNIAVSRTRGRFVDPLDRVDIPDIRFHIFLSSLNVVSFEVFLRNYVPELPPTLLCTACVSNCARGSTDPVSSALLPAGTAGPSSRPAGFIPV